MTASRSYRGYRSSTRFYLLCGAIRFPRLGRDNRYRPGHSRGTDVSARYHPVRQANTPNVQGDEAIPTQPVLESLHA